MAERASPDIEGFKKSIKITWRKWRLPKFEIYSSPYRKAFYWRYNWANKLCNGLDVLEIPCGMGWGSSLLTNAKSVLGIDISNIAIDVAKKKYKSYKLDFKVGSMEKLELENSSFDAVVCLEGIEHVSQEIGISFVKEAARVLRTNGRLLVSSPRHKTLEHSGNPYHIKEYKIEELIVLLADDFLIDSIIRKDVDDLNVYYLVCQKKY